MEKELCLNSLEEYKNSSLEVLHRKLHSFFKDSSQITLPQIAQFAPDINSYAHLSELEPLNEKQVFFLDDETVDVSLAEDCILKGEFFWEHACAGEATRLGLGTKYLINPCTFTKEGIVSLVRSEKEKAGKQFSDLDEQSLLDRLISPQTLLSLTLGQRHILQILYDLEQLALKVGVDVNKIISSQKMLFILNKKTADKIILEWKQHDFYSFFSEHIFFMIQEDFHGITIDTLDTGEIVFSYDESDLDNKRLHNHGQMMMQKMHNYSLFHFVKTESGGLEKKFLSQEEYLLLLEAHKDMVSFNIEDMDYLNGSIDYDSLSKALELGKEGYGMVMEIVGQNPHNPIKGGAAFFDPIIKKNVMVEGFMLKGISPKDITLLNKNFNHYPNPALTMKSLQTRSLHMPVVVKKAKNGKEYLYFEPVQGDMNFLVDTAFIMRKKLKAINALKKPSNIADSLLAMQRQDLQSGFKELAKRIGFL